MARPVHTSLLIIGGAEDKVGRATVLRRFVHLAGGRQARIVVVPSASSFQDEAVQAYTDAFGRLGAPEVVAVSPQSRRATQAMVEATDRSTGIFMTGGNQLKLSHLLVGTPLADAIFRAYERGAVVAGTSAGASIMSQFMISMGGDGVTPRQRTSQLTSGLGLLPGVIIDQHFDQRARYGRLMALVAGSPNLLGIGIDEDTAAEVRDGRRLTVLGSGAVFIVDARSAVSDAAEARRKAALLISGAIVHSLPSGATFDLHTAQLTGFVEKRLDAVVRASSKADEDSGDAGKSALAPLRSTKRTNGLEN
ncbi:MAG: cyanophycinase [Actinomycetota bacterium]|jgi:cyanophycinase|nr:cyanophycinase [Actinomycetota bacterium]